MVTLVIYINESSYSVVSMYYRETDLFQTV